MSALLIIGLAALLSVPTAKVIVSKMIMAEKQVPAEKRIAAVLKLWGR